jgi:TPR repeat protein
LGLFNLGLCFQHGKGVRKDYPQALSCFQKAAVEELAVAVCHLGSLYEAGDIVRRDRSAAVRHYLLAAGLGSADAMYNLGVYYERVEQHLGRVSENAERTSEHWLTYAARFGQSEAQKALALRRQRENEHEKSVSW